MVGQITPHASDGSNNPAVTGTRADTFLGVEGGVTTRRERLGIEAEDIDGRRLSFNPVVSLDILTKGTPETRRYNFGSS